MEYQQIFGGEPTEANHRIIEVTLDGNSIPTGVELKLKFYLYQSLRLFYANGGGDAYILSVGEYNNDSDAVRKAAIAAGLLPLEEADEPTLVLTPDAYAFTLASDLGFVQQQVLAHCAKMQDRFAIMDVHMGVDVDTAATDFRTQVGNQNLKYGAAYFPILETSISPNGVIVEDSFSLMGGLDLETAATNADDDALLDYVQSNADLEMLQSPITIGSETKTFAQWVIAIDAIFTAAPGNIPATTVGFTESKDFLKEEVVDKLFGLTDFLYGLNAVSIANSDLSDAVDDLLNVSTGNLFNHVKKLYLVDVGYDEINDLMVPIPSAFGTLGSITVPGSTYNVSGIDYDAALNLITPVDITASVPINYGLAPITDEQSAVAFAVAGLAATLTNMKADYDALVAIVSGRTFEDMLITSSVIAGIAQSIRNTGYTLPPCGAVAGVYAAVDASRGVWKAPANVSLNAVTSVIKMAEDELNDLNIPDDGQGKSINAIRFFRGQGILVYGARTLAGNDNEWRYVPVRRLFIMVEESVKKATEPYVFEANNARTWLNVKSMIENFLTGIWRDGGLAGAVPQDAFFVKVGLGQTMTAQDILEGKMIIEIGMAAVRPAEFVILKFSHKLQES